MLRFHLPFATLSLNPPPPAPSGMPPTAKGRHTRHDNYFFMFLFFAMSLGESGVDTGEDDDAFNNRQQPPTTG